MPKAKPARTPARRCLPSLHPDRRDLIISERLLPCTFNLDDTSAILIDHQVGADTRASSTPRALLQRNVIILGVTMTTDTSRIIDPAIAATHANRAVIERFATEFVNKGDLACYAELVSKNFVDHTRPNGGFQSMLDAFNALRAGMPDLRVELQQLIAEGDSVAGRKILRGTHTGTLFGIPATGKSVEIRVTDVVRLADGKFIENWAYNDAAEVMANLVRPRVATSSTPQRAIGEIASYHAHVYFNVNASRSDAVQLATQIAERFAVKMTQLYDKPVGPHPWPMFEAAFEVSIFPTFVPWLMLNRRGLNILIHPNTDDMYADHVIQPLWLGDKLVLKAEGMPRSGALPMR